VKEVAAGPTSCVHADSPLLAIAISNTTSPPTMGFGLTRATVTSRSADRHACGSAGVLADSVGVADGVGEEVAPGVADGVSVAEAVVGWLSPPPGQSRAAKANNPMRPAITNPRRNQ
jgi:hypothetical protein